MILNGLVDRLSNFSIEMSDFPNQDFDDDLSVNTPYHELIARKNEYIENLEFDKAENISKILKQRKVIDYSDALESAEDYIWNKIDELYELYKANCDAALAEIEREEFEIRINADNTFQEMQMRHIDELIRLEKAYALEIMKAKARPVTKQIEYINQAKRYAKADNFKDANLFRIKGKDAFIEEHRIRRQQIDEKFNIIKKQYFERHKNELVILGDKLKTSLKQKNHVLEGTLNNFLKQFKVSVIAEHKRTIEKLTSQFSGKEIKKVLSNSINQLVYDKMKSVSGIDLNPYSPSPNVQKTSSPRKQNSPSSKIDNSGSMIYENQEDEIFADIPDNEAILDEIYGDQYI
ncbi:hypothetical protein TRFO_37966 [Tritrichomonas foetus]|uniref:Uncharacterized protein n=1 Tax=Tritrichomonas foetus TaxID=1144522 RepID=A0A1J4JFA3_9EUKA|nr:hypothetical protein TRFO_37966 [Tritrichomonas foetus]|eukprot:OHS95916.1 hypothetical protein TRFO_37966 [Tritrichomonas foetus]